jgi:hypothetical protein
MRSNDPGLRQESRPHSLLVTTDLTESDGTGPVPVGLLDTAGGTAGGLGLAGSLGGDWKSQRWFGSWLMSAAGRMTTTMTKAMVMMMMQTMSTHAACGGPCHRWTCGRSAWYGPLWMCLWGCLGKREVVEVVELYWMKKKRGRGRSGVGVLTGDPQCQGTVPRSIGRAEVCVACLVVDSPPSHADEITITSQAKRGTVGSRDVCDF